MRIKLLLVCLVLCGCRRGMVHQPRVNPLSENNFFDNASGARPLPAHTVARGQLEEDDTFYTGLTNGHLVAVLPVAVTRELLARGRERFEIYCAVCHGRTGEGNGIVVQRGFPRPPSFHEQRLREAPAGHFFDVIRNGYGVMYSYAARVEPKDRWAIVAYIRALQLSRRATPEDLPSGERAKLGALER
jgi:mono/diheme cytochrome c family protein